jgi:hypothetical protein
MVLMDGATTSVHHYDSWILEVCVFFLQVLFAQGVLLCAVFVVCLTNTEVACRMAGFDHRALPAQITPVM